MICYSDRYRGGKASSAGFNADLSSRCKEMVAIDEGDEQGAKPHLNT